MFMAIKKKINMYFNDSWGPVSAPCTLQRRQNTYSDKELDRPESLTTARPSRSSTDRDTIWPWPVEFKMRFRGTRGENI